MKKIRLDIDALDVQSFATVHPSGARGTVLGADSDLSYERTYGERTCPQEEACWLREETVDTVCLLTNPSCPC
jgi:hypothetical protein